MKPMKISITSSMPNGCEKSEIKIIIKYEKKGKAVYYVLFPRTEYLKPISSSSCLLSL